MSNVTITREVAPPIEEATLRSNIGMAPIRVHSIDRTSLKIEAEPRSHWYEKRDVLEWAKALVEVCSE